MIIASISKYSKYVFVLALCMFVMVFCYRWGAGHVQAKWDAAEAKRAEQVHTEQKRTDTVTAKSTAQVAASDAAAEVRYQYIEKEVIKYVKSPAPAANCHDDDWLHLYNASYGAVPSTASGTHGAAEGIPANP